LIYYLFLFDKHAILSMQFHQFENMSRCCVFGYARRKPGSRAFERGQQLPTAGPRDLRLTPRTSLQDRSIALRIKGFLGADD
jgi:hypothetical protein